MRTRIPLLLFLVLGLGLGLGTTQQSDFQIYQLEVYCGDPQVATVIFGHRTNAMMGTKVICVGNCRRGSVDLQAALAGLPADVSRAFHSQIEKNEQDAAAGKARSIAGCLGRKGDTPGSKCDKEKACEAIEAMEKTIAKYDGTILGTLPGSFAEMMAAVSKEMQTLSDALACRFNDGYNAADAKVLNDFVGQLLKDKNAFYRSGNQAKLPAQISCDSDLGNPASNECRDYRTLERIRDNLSRFAGVLGCKGPPQSRVPKADCKELSNGVLDGLTTFFDELDKSKPKNQIGSGDSYDQVAGGIEGALEQLEEAAEEIEGRGGTGSQQYKDLQGKIAKLKKLLDVWSKMKAASCLPPEVEQLLRRLAAEKKAGAEHKATCTELCAATADWYVKMTGLPNQRSAFFKACTLACF